jgi:phenylpyruvate tautomerase
MTSLEGGVPMTFAGDATAPVAYLEVKSVGKMKPATTSAISADLCALVAERLGVPSDRIYIEFADAVGAMWGWNGATF